MAVCLLSVMYTRSDQIRSDVAADDIRCDPISSDICVLLADGESR